MSPETRGWLDRAAENLKAADILYEHGMIRVAVSRVYYAMFYVATALLESKELRYKSHAAVIAAFGQHFARTGLMPKEYHRYLLNAFDERNLADYETGLEVAGGDFLTIREHAAEFLDHAQRMLNG